MHRAKFLLAGIAVLLSSKFALGDFKQRVQEEVSASKAYPCASAVCPSQDEVSQYQFIFVEGFLGSATVQNFIPLENVLQNDFQVDDFTIVIPRSANSIATNAPLVREAVLDFRRRSPEKKSILIAHSKGAAEALLMVLQHPELITDGLISEVVLVDGAFNGTPLAYLWQDFCHLGRMTEIAAKDLDLCRILMSWTDGVNSMKPNRIRPIMAQAIASISEGTKSSIGKHLWSIHCQFGDLRTQWKSKLAIPWAYLKLYGDNDGVILTADENLQTSLGIGTDLGLFFSDHMSLLSGTSVAELETEREGFARALIRQMVIQSSVVEGDQI